jgi:hypothetical protein
LVVICSCFGGWFASDSTRWVEAEDACVVLVVGPQGSESLVTHLKDREERIEVVQSEIEKVRGAPDWRIGTISTHQTRMSHGVPKSPSPSDRRLTK